MNRWTEGEQWYLRLCLKHRKSIAKAVKSYINMMNSCDPGRYGIDTSNWFNRTRESIRNKAKRLQKRYNLYDN